MNPTVHYDYVHYVTIKVNVIPLKLFVKTAVRKSVPTRCWNVKHETLSANIRVKIQNPKGRFEKNERPKKG
uniref:Uncharacterized protein n=1 Tax=Anguilla anguilla TaxID=7936 RepID=A0A0E9T0F6_ANGAN